jgi:hypothetical protein
MPGLVQLRMTGDKEFIRKLHSLSTRGRVKAGKRILSKFQLWYANEVKRAWDAVKVTGGMFRGVMWPALKEQYKRETDGVTVPAWGGVPKVKFKMGSFTSITWKKSGQIGKRKKLVGDVANVQAKLRHGNVRVKQSDVMMVDTKNMRADFFFKPKFNDGNKLILTNDPGNFTYAEVQNDRRRFAFWIPSDETMFRAFAVDGLNQQLREEGLT